MITFLYYLLDLYLTVFLRTYFHLPDQVESDRKVLSKKIQ